MKTALFAYSKRGVETGLRVKALLSEPDMGCFTIEKYLVDGFEQIKKPSKDFYKEIFNSVETMIFVGSCGIAVREIAPNVKSKTTDPAVIVIDELATYVISLLSGHIGGANEMAGKLAEGLGATPVITTATDINKRFSVDAWAARMGLIIDNMKIAKDISASILEHDIPMRSDLVVKGALPNGVVNGDSGELGIYIGHSTENVFSKTLRLIPKDLYIGIGCRRDTKIEAIRECVEMVLREEKIDKRAIISAASIDIKSNEAGLLAFCKEENWDIDFYSSEELLSVEGTFSSSSFVKSITGVDNVCERSALYLGDELIVKKTALNGVTCAIARINMEIEF